VRFARGDRRPRQQGCGGGNDPFGADGGGSVLHVGVGRILVISISISGIIARCCFWVIR
jgi:hypothetical protein